MRRNFLGSYCDQILKIRNREASGGGGFTKNKPKVYDDGTWDTHSFLLCHVCPSAPLSRQQLGFTGPSQTQLMKKLPAMPFGGSWKDCTWSKQHVAGSFSGSLSQPLAHLLVFLKGRTPRQHTLAQALKMGMASAFPMKHYASLYTGRHADTLNLVTKRIIVSSL